MSEATHPEFLKALRTSQEAVWCVVRWFTRKGYTVSVPPYREAPCHEAWRAHRDAGDLYLLQRIEVKRLSVSFTGKHDWPFGAEFIVCARHAFDDATPPPYAYLILSQDLRCAAVVYGSDHGQWWTATRTDRRYHREQEFYFSPLDLVRWRSLDDDGELRRDGATGAVA